MKTVVRFLGGWFEVFVVALALAFGLVAASVAMHHAEPNVSVGFYETIAQVLPVFLIALAVEQRLVDRLGITEEEYVTRADQALGIAVGAAMAYESEEYVEARALEESFDSQPEFSWVGRFAGDVLFDQPDMQPDIPALARSRYRRQRKNEAVFLIAVIAALMVGEGSALAAVLHGGSDRCSPLLGLAIGSTVAVVSALTLSAARELIGSLRA